VQDVQRVGVLSAIAAYREGRLSKAGRRSLFPLWGRNTTELAREFVETGFEAVVCCVDPRRLDAAFAGRAYDERFLSEPPAHVDPCGENGEFHTFVWAGPIFAEPLHLQIGAVVERDGFVFCDLMWAQGGRPTGTLRDPDPRAASTGSRLVAEGEW
jgi:diphthamide synthase (EF-2-diphthine--ammonia ligase)